MRNIGRQRGFTLMEALMAITLTAMICAVLYGVVYSTMSTHARLAGYNSASLLADRIADMIADDLKAVYVAHYEGKNPFTCDNSTEGGLDADVLTLVTGTPTKMPAMPNDEAGIRGFNEVSYVAVPSKTREGFLALYRREAALDDDASRGGRFALLHDQVEKFDIRFLGKDDEIAEEINWEAAAEEWTYGDDSGLPRAARISVIVSIGDPALADDPNGRFRRQEVSRVVALQAGMDKDMSKLTALEPKSPKPTAQGPGSGTPPGTTPGQPPVPGQAPGGNPGAREAFLKALQGGGRAGTPPPRGGGNNPILQLLRRHQMGR